MSLADYKAKRKFDKTPEPPAKKPDNKSKKLEFVIQKHAATRLHYDFRLEVEGVMKSWAIPKGPSLNPADKRLAMMTEDHPLAYNQFEGVIPEGNYGAGNVIIWDRGTYEPLVEIKKANKTKPSFEIAKITKDEQEKILKQQFHKGDLKFRLNGQKIKGKFALVKMQRADEENAWLLIKKDDEYADPANDITKADKSVVSGKRLGENADIKLNLNDAKKARMPKNVRPTLATLVDSAFNDKDWIFEIKWDGYRAIAAWDSKSVQLYSRQGNDFESKYKEIVEAVRSLKHQAVLDGEIVSVDSDGKSHFEWLQNYVKKPNGQLIYYVFDILWIDGYDISQLPLTRRKEILAMIVPKDSIIRFSDHIKVNGQDFFESAKQQGLEGIMAKKVGSTYQFGRRTKDWLKIKTHQRQEAVIGGFTEPRGSRKHIGALVLGVYKNDDLIYIGHTGGGIPSDQMPQLRANLEKLEINKAPFKGVVKPNAPVHWVKPKLVCEVTFGEWTDDDRMRQPIFVGLRTDKDPKKINREVAKPANKIKNKKISKTTKPNSKKASKFNFTNLDKVFWPELGYTKGDLLRYYEDIADVILPYLKDRPESLLRHPNGYKGKSFFQKDVNDMPPDWVTTVEIYSESNQKNINYLVCNDQQTLFYMVQLGCIEINPWNSKIKSLQKPDWIVMDLDPEGVGFDKVVETAQAVKQICDELSITSYPKTSGKTGIHIYIPMQAKYTYDQAKQFAEVLANLVQARMPKITSVERMPAKRRNKVYVDFLQNREAQTLAAPYSVRPTKTASVSTPLTWDEVTKRLDPTKFTITTTRKRLNKVGDLWRPVVDKGIDLNKILRQF
jgi:bifunctional non-homologous end joining protein LigD